MYVGRFELGSMAPGELSAHARCDVIASLTMALTYVNRLWLPFHEDTPPLYSSGVVYSTDGVFGPENAFRDILATLALGHGHCVALTAWRCAELLEAGQRPTLRITEFHPTPDTIDFHVWLSCKGSDEDPSKRLGMDQVLAGESAIVERML